MLSLEFVATPDPDAEVRCALHDPDSGVYVAQGGFDEGTADFLGSAGGVGGDDGYRRLTITQTVRADEWSALRFQSSLARELLRPENWLRVQITESTPVRWYHTWRTTPGSMNLRYVESGIWQFTVQVDADAYSVGEEVQQGVRLSNDPTAGGVAVVLEDTPGDAPAPLVISGVDQDAGSLFRPLIAVTPLSEWAGIQTWKPAAADFQPTSGGTGLVVGTSPDTEATGGSSAYAVVNTSTGVLVRLSVTTVQAGDYRLFVRVRGTSSHMTITGGGLASVSPTVTKTLPDSTSYFYVNLGTYAFPRGNQPLAPGYTLQAAEDASTPEVTFTAKVDSGSSTIYPDLVIAVPVELFESQGESRMLALSGALLGQRIDGDQERLGPIPSPTPIASLSTVSSPLGDFPRIYPGAVNVMHFLTLVQMDNVPMANLSEPLGTVATLNIRHRPRFLYQASA